MIRIPEYYQGISLNPYDMNTIGIGIDLGGTKCAGALFTIGGEILSRDSVTVVGLEGIEVGKTVADLALKLMYEAERFQYGIQGLYVSVPGIAYPSTGTVWAPNIPGWQNYPLIADLHKLLGRQFPIGVDNDRACSILGEVWLGAAGGCRDAVFLAVGTGIGAGILSGGKIIRGSGDIAGAIGWMALDTDFRPGYERFGSFEYNASGRGLVRVAMELIRKNQYNSTILNEKDLDTRIIFKAYHEGDLLAKAVIDHAITYWGKAVANLVSIFDPEVILFGGGVFGPGVTLLDPIYNEAKRWAQPVSIQKVKLLPSKLGQDSALCGAGKMAVEMNLSS